MMLIGRRNFLAGLGLGVGAHLLTPICRSLIGEALGQVNTRKRFFMYLMQGGQESSYWPRQGAQGLDMSPSYEPLAPYKDRLLLVSGLYNMLNVDLHGNGVATLTAVRARGEGQPGGISLDRLLARRLTVGQPALSSVYLHGQLSFVETEAESGTLSASGPGETFPYMYNAVEAHRKIFGGVAMTSQPATGNASKDTDVLSFIRGDIQRLQGKLGTIEKVKLDQYLASVEQLQLQLQSLDQAQATCARPDISGVRSDFDSDGFDPSRAQEEKRVHMAFLDIATNALLCGLTNVVLLFYPEHPINWVEGHPGGHEMWHGKDNTVARHTAYYRTHNSSIASVWSRLSGLREGDRSIADQSLLFAMVGNGAVHHNGTEQHFGVILDGLRAFKANRRVDLPQKQHFIGDLFTSILHAFGVNEKFGDPALTRGPLSQLV